MRIAWLILLGLLAACRLGFDECPNSCNGNELVDCSGTHICPYGCATTDPPHCLALVPSNGLFDGLLDGATASVVAPDLRFDTDTGEITSPTGVVRPAGGGMIDGIGFVTLDEMGVFSANDFTVPAGSTWTASGDAALVLYAATTIAIDGTLDVGALDNIAGPNGIAGGVGDLRTSCDGQNGPFKFSISAGAGAGGAGGATAGGDGAQTAADAMGATSGGPGGTVCMRPSTMPLRGGNGGGAGGTEAMTIMGGAGGGGGGALGLVAMLSVSITGTVAAPGGGGTTIAGGSGGGGGGGGGAIFIETPQLDLLGPLTANGGGGAAATNMTASDTRGERGHVADELPALGGANAGNGGAGPSAPTSGTTTTGGGGGGGAVGTIELRTRIVQLLGLTSPPARQSEAVLE